MQTIINIQIFTSLRLQYRVKFLNATQSICHHTGQMNAPLKRKKKNKMAKVAVDQNNRALVIFFFLSK